MEQIDKKSLIRRGVVKIVVGAVLAALAGFFIWSGVRDVRLGTLDQMVLVSGPECCKVCNNVPGGLCQEVCDGDEVDPRVLLKPVVVCGNKGCRELTEGQDLKCK